MTYADGAAGAQAIDDARAQGLIGQVIEDKYRLDAVLGLGGMGAVFRATRLMIGDTVAVKILHGRQAAHSPDAERFRREAQAAARIKHPNAVGIYDFGSTSAGLSYLVMELVEGESIQELVRRKGPLPVSTVVEVAGQVCAALDEAHRLHVIHRDIKSSNIMVGNAEHSPRVKVLDFGIAKLRDQLDNSLTLTGSVVGTPHYMSPEQCLGEELDHRSDIYSLGVVLYEMLCGVVPFNSFTSTAVIIQHVNQPPQSLRTLNMSVPQSVEAVVLGALAKKPGERPSSAGELAEQLRASASNQAWHIPSQPGPFTTPSMGSNPAVSAGQPTMVLSAQGMSGNNPAAVYTPSGTSAVAPAPVSGQSRLLWMAAVILLALVAGGALTYIFLNREGAAKAQRQEPNARPTVNRQPANNNVATTTSSSPPAVASAPARPPVTGGRRAYCILSGVNLRSEPSNQSAIRTILGSGQQLIVLDTPGRSDTVWIPRARSMVNGEWREVQLADNSSVQGWVFSYFISYEG